MLLLSDRIDEWMMNYLTEFDGKAFQSVAKADESIEKLADEVDENAKEAEKALEPFVERVKTLLGDRVKEVRLTHRLTDTPAIVTTDADEMSTQMAKLFAAAGQSVPEVKYILSSTRIMCWLNALPIPRMKRSLKSGSSCCWIRRCSLNVVRWKIRTSLSAV